MNPGLLSQSAAAKCRLMAGRAEPLLLSNWIRALFIHFEVDSEALQTELPFRLDLREGKAYVSLVAFTMSRMRPRLGGRLAELCFQPVATYDLLNLRTYVRHGGEAGIYFLSEWVPNRLSAFLGPRTFGLPYRLGCLNYQHHHQEGRLHGHVESVAHLRDDGPKLLELEYTAKLSTIVADRKELHEITGATNTVRPCGADSLDEFLLERYTAFTERGRTRRFFRVWHTPWPQQPAEVSLLDDSLLRGTAPWFGSTKLVGANYSPGVQNVWMGWPHKLDQQIDRRHAVLSSFYDMP